MESHEIIIYEVKDENKIQCITNESVKYSIYSIPFTINRMKLNLTKRIENIVKGKIAETTFELFAKETNLEQIDFDKVKTPYYQIDKGDFMFKNHVWDMKNNYILCSNYSNDDILNFLALIPNNYENDQWSKRHDKAFLFTFMERQNITLNIPEKILKIVEEYYNKYKGKPQNSLPEDFHNRISEELEKYNISSFVTQELNFKLIITGYAIKDKLDKFKDIPQDTIVKNSNNSDCFKTRIRNKGLEIKELPSFKSIIEITNV